MPKAKKSTLPTKQDKLKQFPLPLSSSIVGEVFVVGSGDCGQLGLGTDVLEKDRPARIKYFDDKNIVNIYAGGMHNMALSAQGKLYSWGCNDQLALGRDGEETEPGPVEGLDHEVIVDVACGDSISAALTNMGLVYIWGTFRNNTGIFGMKGGVETQARPVLVEDLKKVVSIAAGSNHLVAVTADGKIYSWGVGDQGQLGRKILGRHAHESSLTPRVINFRPKRLSSKFLLAFCGSYHTFLLHERNYLFAFGLNNYGQLGMELEDDSEAAFEPRQIEGLDQEDPIKMVAGGEHHSMVLTNQGKVYAFGRGDSGQLGIVPSENRFEPTLVPLTAKVESISCGSSFSLAVMNDDELQGDNLYMWGYGEMGQLANHGQDAPEPFKVELKGRSVIIASAGGQHTLFLLRKKEE